MTLRRDLLINLDLFDVLQQTIQLLSLRVKCWPSNLASDNIVKGNFFFFLRQDLTM
jgi:hypothetical protein